MTKNTVSEIERMVVTRVFDAHANWLEGVDRPKYVMQWWARGLYFAVCQMDFRVGGKPSAA